MTQIVIDKKKYVLLSQDEYYNLQRKAALKTKPEKLLSLEEGRAYSKKLIRKVSVRRTHSQKAVTSWELSKFKRLVFPVVGKQFFDAVDRMRGDSFQYISKIFKRINAM